ncbi:MAG: MiaB/RimO family radical SAM methylthiotransferase [Desulfovermiculus sp.]|nr:MiaB/RimO family radical SAM methylthiotransferase [Desulfovermiculus sp.]
MPDMAKTFYLLTQGCKINQYESQALLEAWQARGGRQTTRVEEAETIVINSCAVTEKSLQDLRKTIRRCRQANESAHLVVTGCAAQMCVRDMGDLSGVDRIVPQQDKVSLTDWPPPNWPQSNSAAGCNGQHEFPLFRISRFQRARPVLKVQDGCSRGCTYCIVPLTRGAARSRNPEEVAAEAERLLANGYRELILSGINLAQYRSEGMDFWDLVRFLEGRLAPGWQREARLRLSSLDPSQLGSKALDVLNGSRMICPHLHLSVQSASPRVLQTMGRFHYHPDRVTDFLVQLFKIWPEIALGGDFLVGFPGETQDEMQETLDWFAAQPFTYAHVFTYSPRPGTKAAQVEGQVKAEAKKERSQCLRELAAEKGREFAQRLLAAPSLQVVMEGDSPGAGRCEYYVPCTFTHKPEAESKSLVSAVPVQAEGAALLVRSG